MSGDTRFVGLNDLFETVQVCVMNETGKCCRHTDFIVFAFLWNIPLRTRWLSRRVRSQCCPGWRFVYSDIRRIQGVKIFVVLSGGVRGDRYKFPL